MTLVTLYFIPDRLLVLLPLTLTWLLCFYPVSSAELVMFAVAAVVFLFQNYVTLSAGVFEFKFKDVLLMPYYEPFLWGFYFLCMKRFVSGRSSEHLRLDGKAVVAVVTTSLVFSFFAFDSRVLFFASTCSTLFLFVLFHERQDIAYALFALTLGFIVELFGVSTGLWWYPAPDFLGMPYWFATMWISVGLLGRRFLIPTCEWIAGRWQPSAAVAAR